jgi:4-amino-4-deoxychorismate lyase
LDLGKILEIPEFIGTETYKCRVVYGKEIESIEFAVYQPKLISTLKLIEDNEIDYSYKFADRENINRLYGQRGSCDDILIVKNNLITDTSYCNILFFDGTNWITPESPLLKGTKRQQLLDEGKIRAARITVDSLRNYQKFMLINALLDFDEKRSQSINGIKECDESHHSNTPFFTC